MIRASVRISLTGCAPDRQRHRVAVLSEAPDGCHVDVVIGMLPVEPATIRELAEHERRLTIELQGAPSAVWRWHRALCDERLR